MLFRSVEQGRREESGRKEARQDRSPSRPARGREERSAVAERPRKETNLDDLRKTLRTIAGAPQKNGDARHSESNKKKNPETKDAQTRPSASKENNQPRNDLKAALAEVLTSPPSSPKKDEVRSEEKDMDAAPKAESEISANELERMMRVTTSDKPPLK